jgi:hypothetical protein
LASSSKTARRRHASGHAGQGCPPDGARCERSDSVHGPVSGPCSARPRRRGGARCHERGRCRPGPGHSPAIGAVRGGAAHLGELGGDADLLQPVAQGSCGVHHKPAVRPAVLHRAGISVSHSARVADDRARDLGLFRKPAARRAARLEASLTTLLDLDSATSGGRAACATHASPLGGQTRALPEAGRAWSSSWSRGLWSPRGAGTPRPETPGPRRAEPCSHRPRPVGG